MMEILSILVVLFIIWAVFKSVCGAIGWLHAKLEKPLGYALWGVIIFVVISWFF